MEDIRTAGETGEVIVVGIGGQQFAIDIMSVREIRGWTISTPLPGSPDHVLGMINLRGAVLPVVDLGARLGLGDTSPDSSSVVVVAQIHDRQVGLLVDAVEDILAVSEDMLQATPEIGSEASRAFVASVMTTDTGIVSLLSLDEVLPAHLVEAA
jgi:purine-binding chemotaxis protein CheW